ncbi:hypothetical protein SLS56_008231 [Neofusicoccum ribis]|uniref:MARVEL domain-containing protein n=1 Tax=Neofusicoccum ribis TaxID=45134 RepID=A0ABR3SKQ1_9PEZI
MARLFFALLIVGLTAYALSVQSGSQIRPALILTLIFAVLTVFPIFPFTLPLSTALVHPLGTLVSDFLGTLFWLASLVALASYLRVFSYYRKVESIPWAPGAPKIARAWRCGVAACVFAALELLLFLVTLKLFAYFYHHHRAGSQPNASLLRSTARLHKSESFSLQNTSNGGGAATAQPPTTTAFAQQDSQQPPANTISPPVSPLQPTAPAHGGLPSITTTAATPTVATNHQTPATFTAPRSSPYAPGQGTGYADPIIPDPEFRVSEKARPPYPVDEDEERGAVGKDQSGGAKVLPVVLTPGVSGR